MSQSFLLFVLQMFFNMVGGLKNGRKGVLGGPEGGLKNCWKGKKWAEFGDFIELWEEQKSDTFVCMVDRICLNFV